MTSVLPLTSDLYHPLWKLERNYVNAHDYSLMSDAQCDFYEDERKEWQASLPSPYERRSALKEDWLNANPNLRHDPDSFTQRLDWREVRESTSVPRLLDTFALTKRRDYGGKSTFCCLWHDDSSPSLSFSHERKAYYCFGCGQKGGLYDFVMKMNDCTFGDAVKYCKDNAT